MIQSNKDIKPKIITDLSGDKKDKGSLFQTIVGKCRWEEKISTLMEHIS